MYISRPEKLPEERFSGFRVSELSELQDALEIVSRETILRGKKRPICADFGTFDTETSSVSRETLWNDTDTDLGFIYLGQIYISGRLFFLRSMAEISIFFQKIADFLQRQNACIVFYVHNLSFEWQFLKSYLPIDDVFALKNRRIARVYAYDYTIEFRCSYLLSNMSLEKFTENYCDPMYQKDKELIDYEVIRYPWTDLDNNLFYYSGMDVIALYHAVSSIMEREHDNIVSIPMTNTGYVRRACQIACIGEKYNNKRKRVEQARVKEIQKYKHIFQKCKLTYEQYEMCVQAFRGGNTHASRFYADQKISDVYSYDFASSYPAIIICSNEFPMGKLIDCTKDLQNPKTLMRYAESFFLIVTLVIEDIRLRDPYHTSVPYIPTAKVIRDRSRTDVLFDNGRIMKHGGLIEYTCLGCELPIIMKQYTGKIAVKKAYYTNKGYLPDELRKCCYQWFQKKTELKGVSGSEYEYMKSKNRVNSVYGMMVEQIIKEIIELGDDMLLHSRKPTIEEAEKQLLDYYTPMQHKFLAYQWGITVTALARVRLQDMIDIAGDDFVYCDTDSCKMINYDAHRKEYEELNNKWYQYAERCGIPFTAYTRKNELQILGNADLDAHYQEFKTLGAKKYCYLENNKLHITIAGVPKTAGAQLMGSIDNFQCGYKFQVSDNDDLELRQSWKKQLTYNDECEYHFNIDGHDLEIKSNVAILRTTYELDITDEYKELLEYDYTDYEYDDV